MDHRKSALFTTAGEALVQCQLLELQLNLHISNAIELREKKPAAPLPFKMKPKRISAVKKRLKKATLGELIDFFGEVSDAPGLLESLKNFNPKRVRLAHGLLASCIDLDGDLLLGMADAVEGEIRVIKEEATRLNDEVQQASVPWIVHLYFDDLDAGKPA